MRRSLMACGIAALVVSACARRGSPGATAPDPPLSPMPKIAEAPPGTKTCAETRPLLESGARAATPVRAVFAGCHTPPCPPCPPEVNCSPCEPGWCELTGDDASCVLRVQLAFECRPEPGHTYVFSFAASGGPEIASCAELMR